MKKMIVAPNIKMDPIVWDVVAPHLRSTGFRAQSTHTSMILPIWARKMRARGMPMMA